MLNHAVSIWIFTGCVAGITASLVTRAVPRAHRGYDLFEDLTAGCLGAVFAGWVLRRLAIWTPVDLPDHVLVASVGAAMLLIAVRLSRYLGAAATGANRWDQSARNDELERRLNQATGVERGLVSRLGRRRQAYRDVNRVYDAQLTFGERVADRVATFGGSWVFLGICFASIISWMAINEDLTKPFDPYPFILLNLVLSCLAAVQAPIIMMSQNRQAYKDRIEARNDFEVNLRAEVEIMALHEKLDAVRSKELLDLMGLLEAQMQRLGALEEALRSGEGLPGHDTEGGPV